MWSLPWPDAFPRLACFKPSEIRHDEDCQTPQTLTCAAMLACGLSGLGHAEEKFVYMTNWYAQAEHGGFYQAVATGLYKRHGLDVSIKMGGPRSISRR